MGSASSRPLQKLPKTLSQHKPPLPSIPKSATPAPKPAEDPPNLNLLSNLAQLGQVRVQNPPIDIPPEAFRTTPSPSSLSLSLSRTTTTSKPSSSSSSSPFTKPRNTLSAPALSTLLDTLKSDQHAPTLAHAKQLVQQLGLDWEVYQRIAMHVNSPTIGRHMEIQSTHHNSNSVRILKEVIWVDPPYTRTSPPPL